MMKGMVDAALVAKRHIETRYPDKKDGTVQLPPWTIGLALLDFIIFLPALLVVGYTLNQLYLTLAMVEDPNPPAYEPLSTDDTANVAALADEAQAIHEPAKPITSSLRETRKLVRSIAGWRSNFRGIACAFVLSILTSIAEGFFSAFSLSWIGTLLASLVLVQFSTAWVVIAISQPSPKPFWRRLPGLRKAFEATCFPVLVNWLAQSAAIGLPTLLVSLLGLPTWKPDAPREIPTYDGHVAWKGLVIFITAMALQIFLVIPSEVMLRRVQASLLPPDEDAIIPFDRSFQGTVEPAIVGGKGYVTLKDAFKTFSRASWIRLYKVYLKIFAVSFAVYLVMFSVIFFEVLVVGANSSVEDGN